MYVAKYNYLHIGYIKLNDSYIKIIISMIRRYYEIYNYANRYLYQTAKQTNQLVIDCLVNYKYLTRKRGCYWQEVKMRKVFPLLSNRDNTNNFKLFWNL